MLNLVPIKLSDAAKTQLLAIRKSNNIGADFHLRVGAKAGGGCSGGFTYVLGFDQEKEGDQSYEIDGFHVLINKAQALYLFGMEIDWYDGEDTKGFIFNNPQTSDNEGDYFKI